MPGENPIMPTEVEPPEGDNGQHEETLKTADDRKRSADIRILKARARLTVADRKFRNYARAPRPETSA